LVPSVCTASSMVGYVQQMDTFIAMATVREALHFSARLRLPANTAHSSRVAIVVCDMRSCGGIHHAIHTHHGMLCSCLHGRRGSRRYFPCEQESVLETLHLRDVAGVMIGYADAPFISPAQRKLLTIGLELVANPSILFVDEPTTGLDSKAALVVRAMTASLLFSHSVSLFIGVTKLM
jgi:ABC-type multidrug transport system ATPase subunit